MAKNTKPNKAQTDFCDKLRTALKRLVEEIKQAGLSTAAKKRLREQCKILGDQIADECSDAKIKTSDDR